MGVDAHCRWLPARPLGRDWDPKRGPHSTKRTLDGSKCFKYVKYMSSTVKIVKEKSSVFLEKLFFECLMSAPGLRLAGIFSFLDLFALRLRRFCFRLLTCKQNGQEVLQ